MLLMNIIQFSIFPLQSFPTKRNTRAGLNQFFSITTVLDESLVLKKGLHQIPARIAHTRPAFVPYCSSTQSMYSPNLSNACQLPFKHPLKKRIGELERAGQFALSQSSCALQSRRMEKRDYIDSTGLERSD